MKSTNTFNKFKYILLAALLCLCLAACGNDDSKNDKFSSALQEINNSYNSAENENNTGNISDNSSSTDTNSHDSDDASPVEEPDSITDSSAPENLTPVIIVLDPGHGGIFGGAYFDGRREEIMTLKVAMYARAYLEENFKNVEVYLTRESNTELSKDLVEELEMRAIFAKEKNADALVSLHFNASEKHDMDGATVYISRRPNVHDTANELAESILQELLALGLKRQGVLMRKSNDMFDEEGEPFDYYAINRHCANRDLVGIIVEHCFMDNTTDIKYLDTEEALKKLGEADAIGIAKHYKLESR